MADELKAYTDYVDTYVATSVDEAKRFQRELLGITEEDQEGCEWCELPPDRELSILIEDQMDVGPMIPKEGHVKDLNDGKLVTKTVAAWIKSNGRGFLSSTNF